MISRQHPHRIARDNAQRVGALLMAGWTREDAANRLGFSLWRLKTLERIFWRKRIVIHDQTGTGLAAHPMVRDGQETEGQKERIGENVQIN